MTETLDRQLIQFRMLRAALLTFIASIPFYATGVHYLGYYLGFIFLFTVIADIALHNKAEPFCKRLFNKHPLIITLLGLWVVSSTLSLAIVLFDEGTSTKQIVTSFVRHLYDINMLAFVIVLAKLLAINILKMSDVFIALAVGFVLLIAVQICLYYQLPISAQLWFSEPPFGPHIRDQGNLACVVAVSMAALLLNFPMASRMKTSCFACLFLVGLSFVIWSGGRMAIFATLLTLFFLIVVNLFVSNEKKLQKFVLLFVLIALAFVVAEQMSVFPWNGISRLFAGTSEVTAVVESSPAETVNQLTTGRAEMWKMSINAMLSKPWFGLGPYGYFFIPERVYDDQPHNFMVQFLVEWGVLGAGLMLMLMVICVWKMLKQMIRRREHPDVEFLIAAAVVCVLTLHGLTGGTYFKIQPFTCLVLAYAVMAATFYRSAAKSSQ